MALWLESKPVRLTNITDKLNNINSEDELQVVIRAAYRQVLGNAHVMDSQRLTEAESQLRDGRTSVADFVRAIGQSELYRTMFFENSSAYRFVELNFKHFLGRAPQNQTEVAEHMATYHTKGYEAEIDSYIDSDEYKEAFGDDTVPYIRGNASQPGISNVSFNRTFAIARGDASSDISNVAKLIRDIAGNIPTKIVPPAQSLSGTGNRAKRYRLTVAGAQAGPRVTRVSRTKVFEVSYDQLSRRLQDIQKSGGQVVSINEVS
ncbi:Phycobilisome linker polypeptide (plasmid) [Thalassoporum mexicanum PCC 7367]|uniref:phycobilisome rod-core linker polypeptide n=1 Tax=Thalassoporum mexicanum TaxID=3457544 RepID=UPI00029F8136|nr:phycobilisome rod-core linker polypeptide [Pseudanabaena sp. PCC 7367]AFY72116.1 Phycobilisome linker polypeptide [Pseudanabaena sp. PCC 7367]